MISGTSVLADLVPVTVIGGYLGAGKTTMINAMLRDGVGPDGQPEKLAVLVNDFGSINIDAELITSHDGSTISLENGCVCCSIADAMGDALDDALAAQPDRIVIEASGVADPAKVGVYGQGWPGCRLAAIIVLADASQIRTQAKDRFIGHLVQSQLGSADVVILTKTDLINSDQTAAVQAWIDDRTGPDAPALVIESPLGAASELFDSEVIDPGPELTRGQLDEFIEQIDDSVARVKGIIAVDDRPHLVQLAGSRWTVEPTDQHASPTGLVVIRRV